MKLVLSEPHEALVEELSLEPQLELGPFDEINYADGWFFGDGEKIAEVFAERVSDMMASVTGHPAAGLIFAPRTFSASESDDPAYPGKPYGKVTVIS